MLVFLLRFAGMDQGVLARANTAPRWEPGWLCGAGTVLHGTVRARVNAREAPPPSVAHVSAQRRLAIRALRMPSFLEKPGSVAYAVLLLPTHIRTVVWPVTLFIVLYSIPFIAYPPLKICSAPGNMTRRRTRSRTCGGRMTPLPRGRVRTRRVIGVMRRRYFPLLPTAHIKSFYLVSCLRPWYYGSRLTRNIVEMQWRERRLRTLHI